jgi:hypothetical protein
MLLQKRRDDAIKALHKFLSENHAGLRLSSDEVVSETKGAFAAWRLTIGTEACIFSVDDDFPCSHPDIALGPNTGYFQFPHVERYGRLCLNPSQTSYAQDDVPGVADYLIRQAKELLESFETGYLESDFIAEFRSYWSRDNNLDKRAFLSLVQPHGPSRAVACFQNEKLVVYAETAEGVQTWLRNRYGPSTKRTVQSAVFVWFPEGITPPEYPKTAGQFYQLAKSRVPESVAHLNELVDIAGHVLVLFGFDTVNGPALASIVIYRPKGFEKGFRPGRIHGEVAQARTFGATTVGAGEVFRVDHGRIHTRGGEADHASLAEKSVMVIGCGSLGSGVAGMLAKSGVGRLVLCDPELLTWENIARHHLGGESVKMAKTDALSAKLRAQLPHLQIESIRRPWQAEYQHNPKLFTEMDLIICTTAEWGCESTLNYVARRSATFPPVLFGWLEPHAMAGHGMLVADIGGCLGCGSDKLGAFAKQLTQWPNDGQLVSEAACGGQYQPFGWVFVSYIHALISEMIIDALHGRIPQSQLRSWIASKSTVERFGGAWTQHATGLADNRLESFTAIQEWPCADQCELCGAN